MGLPLSVRREGCILRRVGKEEKEITQEVLETGELCTFCTNAPKVHLSSGESSFPISIFQPFLTNILNLHYFL
jgi:hypothetical protein